MAEESSYIEYDELADGIAYRDGEVVAYIDDEGDAIPWTGPTATDDVEEPEPLYDWEPGPEPVELDEDGARRLIGDFVKLEEELDRGLTSREIEATMNSLVEWQEATGDTPSVFDLADEALTPYDLNNRLSRHEYLAERANDLQAPPQTLTTDQAERAARGVYGAADGPGTHDDRMAYYSARLNGQLSPNELGDLEYTEAEE